ncbi:MAG: hypothetical protein ACLFPL_05755 [Candidatus Nanoarchaeia archaeon]
MVRSVKFLIFMIAMILSLGAVQADPFTLEDVNIQEVNGEYVSTVTINNENVSSGEYAEVFFELEGVVSRESVTVEVASSTQTFDLSDVLSNYDDLVVGNSYVLNVEVDNSSVSESFVFGSLAEESGLPISVEQIEANGARLNDFSSLSVENGGQVTIDVSFIGQRFADNARMRADIQGYEQSVLEDSTDLFTVREGVASSKTLTIDLPADMDNQKEYILRVYGSNDLSGLTYKEYSLYVDTQRHRVDIVDLVQSPSTGVEPGQAVIANVRMQNRGQKVQDSVKTIIEVPELNLRAESFVSNLDVGESQTSEDMYLGVPRDAQSGVYEANVYTQYNDGYTQSQSTFDFAVLSSTQDESDEELIIGQDTITQEFEVGKTTSFDITIGNPSSSSKAISVVPGNMDWAAVSVTPTFGMIQSGSDRVFTVEVTPNSEASGTQNVNLLVKDVDETVEELSIPVGISEAEKSEGYNWLNIALIAFIVVLVLILLILLISVLKGKGDDRGDKDSFDTEHESADEYY